MCYLRCTSTEALLVIYLKFKYSSLYWVLILVWFGLVCWIGHPTSRSLYFLRQMLDLWVYCITFCSFSSISWQWLGWRAEGNTVQKTASSQWVSSRTEVRTLSSACLPSCGLDACFLAFTCLFLNSWVLGKRANSQENRNYLRLWTPENKSKSKNAKDLPKLNQVGV